MRLVSARQSTAQQLEQARTFLSQFGRLWRDFDVPADLEEQAAREIFDRIELDGSQVVAVHPRAEHAWLLGMHARKTGGLGMVGARGVAPPTGN